MNEIEKAVLIEVSGGTEPRLCLRSKRRVDTGRWWWPTPLWICVMPDQLILLAASRRNYLECLPLSKCLESYYCHATGELVISPVEGVEFNHIALSPANALLVLDAIGVPRER